MARYALTCVHLWVLLLGMCFISTHSGAQEATGTGTWLREVATSSHAGDGLTDSKGNSLTVFPDREAALIYNRNETFVVLTSCHETAPPPTVLALHPFAPQFAVENGERELLIVAKDTHASGNEAAVKLFVASESGKIEPASPLLPFDANHLPKKCHKIRNGESEYLEIGSPERFVLLWTDPNNPGNVVLTASPKGDLVTSYPFGDGRRFLIADTVDEKMQLSVVDGQDPTMNKPVQLSPAVLNAFPYKIVSDGGTHMIVRCANGDVFSIANDGSLGNSRRPLFTGVSSIISPENEKYAWLVLEKARGVIAIDRSIGWRQATLLLKGVALESKEAFPSFLPINGTSQALAFVEAGETQPGKVMLVDAVHPTSSPNVLVPEGCDLIPAYDLKSHVVLLPVRSLRQAKTASPQAGEGFYAMDLGQNPPTVELSHLGYHIGLESSKPDDEFIHLSVRKSGPQSPVSELLSYDRRSGKVRMVKIPPRSQIAQVLSAGDHRHYWMRATPEDSKGQSLWLIDSLGEKDPTSIIPEFPSPSEIYPAADGVHAWAIYGVPRIIVGLTTSGITSSRIRDPKIDNSFSPRQCVLAADPKRAWVFTDRWYLAGFDGDHGDAAIGLTLGSHRVSLTPRDKPQRLQNGEVGIKVDEATLKFAKAHNGTFVLALSDPNNLDSGTRPGTITANADGFASNGIAKNLRFNISPTDVGERRLELTYKDDVGSNMRFSWPSIELVTVEPSWWNTDQGRAVIVWAAAMVLLLFSQTLPLGATVRRLGPAVLTPLLAAGGFLETFTRLDRGLFSLLLVGSGISLVATGWFRPAFLRQLAGIAPFDTLLPIALRWPNFRRRAYFDYVNGLERTLQMARQGRQYSLSLESTQPNDSGNEKYIPLPVADLSANPQRLLSDPAVEICAKLVESDSEIVVLIESPGGRGKTALLRAVTERAIQRFRKTGATALPVLCTGITGTIAERVEKGLGSHRFSSEVTKRQLETGDLLIIIDGFLDAGITPEDLGTLLHGSQERLSRVLVSNRPHDHARAAARASEAFWIVEPLRLDETTISKFEENYGANLSEVSRTACRSKDGTYLQVLVRLAIQIQKNSSELEPSSIADVADIYRGAFDQLIGKTDQRGPAQALCRATYWETGQRILSVDTPAHVDTIRKLLEAGILVPEGRLDRVSGLPREARFFHDTMQSFLTAESLFHAEGGPAWNLLLESAGAARFLAAPSDIAAYGSTELFHMCMQTFGPQQLMIKTLGDELMTWAREYHSSFTADSILAGFAEADRRLLSPDDGIRTLLTRAVEVASQKTDSIDSVPRLYAALAPLVWAKYSSPDAMNWRAPERPGVQLGTR